jgi:hypothetical protein
MGDVRRVSDLDVLSGLFLLDGLVWMELCARARAQDGSVGEVR